MQQRLSQITNVKQYVPDGHDVREGGASWTLLTPPSGQDGEDGRDGADGWDGADGQEGAYGAV